MTAAVTVVVSFYNNRSTISDCVRSVFAQSRDDWELVLLDDGSQDGSGALVAQLRDPRVRVVTHAANKGTPVRLNELTAMVTSPYLARMDGDDLMHPDRLALALEALDSDGSLSFVHGDAVSIDGDSNPVGLRPASAEETVKAHFRSAPYVHATVTGRTSWWAEHPYNPRYRRCQDQELWVRTLGDRVTRRLPGTQLYLREAGTITAAKYATSMRGTRRVLAEHGRGQLGVRSTAMLAGLTYAKELTYRLSEQSGRLDAVIRSRVSPLSSELVVEHRAVIDRIRATDVAGLRDP